MAQQKMPPWLARLIYVGTMTAAVTFISLGAAWGGSKLKLWSFFSKSNPPASSPKAPSTSETLDKKKKESASDEDFTSVVAGSETTNLIQGKAETELKTLTASESDWDSVSLPDTASSGAGSEPTVGSQAPTSLVAISEFTPASVSGSGSGSGSETGGQSSESTEQSQEMPGIDENDDTFLLEYAAYQADYQTKKNIALRNNIRRREDRIQKNELLIIISNYKINELVKVCNLLITLGVSQEALTSGASYKELTRELAIRNKLIDRLETLEDEINEDKAQIVEPSHVDKDTTENRNEPLPLDEEETSLPREEISLAIGPVTKFISTSCSSTRPILPIEIPKEKPPSASDSETPRIGWGRRS